MTGGTVADVIRLSRRDATRAEWSRRKVGRAMRVARNLADSGQAGPVTFRRRDRADRWACLHPSSRVRGEWQLSYFDADGPYTHEDGFASREVGIRHISGEPAPGHMFGGDDGAWEVTSRTVFEAATEGADYGSRYMEATVR